MTADAPNIVGAFANVSFPEFGIENIMAKIDTGAYTGALHCSSINVQNVDGELVLYFLPLNGKVVIHKEEFIIKFVKSSNGKREKRYFISTPIRIQGGEYEIVLSLTDRSKMKSDVLIGRRFLKLHNFVVDPGRITR